MDNGKPVAGLQILSSPQAQNIKSSPQGVRMPAVQSA
jgi:hypothetical protein